MANNTIVGLKIKGITLGITWILFCAIACSHFGMTLDPLVESFAKDLGLILFVYSIGLQVGPGFFSSFGKGGLRLNMLAASIVVLGCATAYVIHLLSGTDIATMTGVLFGAVTNTPGLGAANGALSNVFPADEIPQIASGYACAYPLGVLGIIGATIAIKYLCSIKLEKEEHDLNQEAEANTAVKPHHMHLEVSNKYLEGKTPVITGLRRVSKPGLRIYSNAEDMPKVMKGLGVAIISTSKGVMTDRDARAQHIGGEVLAYIW